MSATSPSAPPSDAGSTRRKKDPPERKYGPFANGVGVCVWVNHVTTDQGSRTFRTVTINPRRYFDKDSNQWKDAPSFNPSDLPSLIFALQQAATYCFDQAPGGDASDGSSSAGGDEIPF